MLVLRVLPDDLVVQEYTDEKSALDIIRTRFYLPQYINRILYDALESNTNLLLLYSTEYDEPRTLLLDYLEHTFVIKESNEDILIKRLSELTDNYYAVLHYTVPDDGINVLLIPVNKLNLFGSAINYFRNKTIDEILKGI